MTWIVKYKRNYTNLVQGVQGLASNPLVDLKISIVIELVEPIYFCDRFKKAKETCLSSHENCCKGGYGYVKIVWNFISFVFRSLFLSSMFFRFDSDVKSLLHSGKG